MKCEDCCHAEMCKWIDELEGRGCDFGEPCNDAISRDAVIEDVIKCTDMDEDTMDVLEEKVKQLPSVTVCQTGKWKTFEQPCGRSTLLRFEPFVTPKSIVCDDAISREAVIDLYDRYRPSLATHVSEFGDELKALPPVTQKSGKWIGYQKNGWIYAQCSECGEVHDSPSVYCPSCGAEMESEDKE